jgi:nicotinamide-nucleotide amidase
MNSPISTIEIVTEIKNILIKRGLWLSVAESLTCGKLQSSIGEVSGISGCFKGGITTYSIIEKVNFLDVNQAEAERVNCVSQSIANQMAQGVCKMFESEIGIATTGYAEKFEDENGNSIEPHAFFAIVRVDKSDVSKTILQGEILAKGRNRTEFQNFITYSVLVFLLDYLNKHLIQD